VLLGLFFIFYIFFPVYLVVLKKFLPLKILLTFYLVNILIVFSYLNKFSKLKYKLDLEFQNIQEKMNILVDEYAQETNNRFSIDEKIKRYNSLKNVIEQINKNLDLDYAANSLIEIAFFLVSGNKGVGIIYLADPKTQKLSLFKTIKEEKSLIIKTKEGDSFDHFVLRHAGPLLIEDIRKDFRFDPDKLKLHDKREFLSLISSPMVSGSRFLGILRLDNSKAGFYTQDDLRLLVAIADIGSVALENGELFQKTQDLAIHDGLTSFYSKGYFTEQLKQECKRSLRSSKPISLLMLDIDNFKNYNDKFGHIAGDIVLKKLSSAINEYLEDLASIVSRFGGEEFCILLLEKDKNNAFKIAEGLRKKIECMKIMLRRQESNITVSVGVSALPDDAKDEEELIRTADKAMYEAKLKGRNKVLKA